MIGRKYKPPRCAFQLVGTHIETDRSVHMKMSGSTLAGIFSISPFNTPFQQACNLLGVCKEDLDGKRSIQIGKELEAGIIEYLGNRYPDHGLFVPAKVLFGEQKGDHDAWKSDFDDEMFSGRMDGMVFDDTYSDVGKKDGYILEIKTTSNNESWQGGVPDYYKVQVELYNHFLPTPKDKAYVAVCLIDDATRKDTSNWVPSDDNIFMFELEIDDAKVSDMLEQAQEWYEDYIAKGITPDYDPSNRGDADMWAHLSAISNSQSEVQKDIDRLETLETEIAEKEMELKPLNVEADELKKRIKDYMVTNNYTSIPTTSKRMAAVISEQERSSIDRTLLVNAGIDPKPFTVTKTVKTFSLKPVKNEEQKE